MGLKKACEKKKEEKISKLKVWQSLLKQAVERKQIELTLVHLECIRSRSNFWYSMRSWNRKQYEFSNTDSLELAP